MMYGLLGRARASAPFGRSGSGPSKPYRNESYASHGTSVALIQSVGAAGGTGSIRSAHDVPGIFWSNGPRARGSALPLRAAAHPHETRTSSGMGRIAPPTGDQGTRRGRAFPPG